MASFKASPLMDLLAAMSSGRDRYSLPGGRDETMLRTDYPMQALSRPLNESDLVALLVHLQRQRQRVRQSQMRGGELYQR